MIKHLFTTTKLLLIGVTFFSCSSSRQSESSFPYEYIVPFGGNTYRTSSNEPDEKVTSNGIDTWVSNETVISTYFKVDKPGKVFLKLFIEPAGEAAKIRVDIAGKSKIVDITAHTDTIEAGQFEIRNAGYVQVDFQGIERGGGNFANLRKLIIKSRDSLQLNYVKNNEGNRFYWGRRGPSVHLTYNLPQEQDFKWFYNEVVVPEGEDVIGSYFMSNGFAEGYFGIQVNSEEERRVLFSVWSPFKTDDPSKIPDDQRIQMLAKGEGVYTGKFGNEGSGGQSYLRYNWKAGNTYRFLTSIEPDGKGNTTYTSYFFAPEVGQWKLIASFLRPKTDTWYKRPHSFLENFRDTKGNIERKAYYQNQWARSVDGKWYELDEARFTGDDTARRGYRLDYSGGEEGDKFFLKNCGFFDETVEIGSRFKRSKSNMPPEIDFEALEGLVM